MVALTVGTATSPVFWREAGFGYLPGDTVLSGVNFTLGAHSLTVGVDSVIFADQRQDWGFNPVIGFIAEGASVWNITVLGHIMAGVTTGGPIFPASAIFLDNVNSSGTGTGLSRVTVGAEGSVVGATDGIRSSGAAILTNLGTISGGVNGAVFSIPPSGDSNLYLSANGTARTITVTNALNAEISGFDYGVRNASYSTLVVTNSGTIAGGQIELVFDQSDELVSADNLAAVQSYGTLRLTNAATGVIDGAVNSQWLGSSIVNAGKINGTIDGFLNLDDSDNGLPFDEETNRIDFNRDGVINSRDFSIVDNRVVGLTVTNTGVIDGHDSYFTFLSEDEAGDPIAQEVKVAIVGSQARDLISNGAAGVILGSLSLYGGNNVLSNAGLIEGRALFGDGSDVITNSATGKIYANEGLSGDFTAINSFGGNDVMSNAGLIQGDVVLGLGNDTYVGAGTVNGALFMDRTFDGGDATNASDRVTISARGYVEDYVFLGEGNNTLINSGTIDGNAYLELGYQPDPEAESETIFGTVIGLSGIDTVTNTASGIIYGGLSLGAGNDIVTNHGRILNDDYVTEAGDVIPAIFMGDGNDRLTNSGTIGSAEPMFAFGRTTTTNLWNELDFDPIFAIDMGAGNDVLINYAVISRKTVTGNIFGTILMGEGNDTVIGWSGSEFVGDEAGADQYLLGAGADGFALFGADGEVDIFDGGTGLDVLAFSVPDGFDPAADFTANPLPLGHRIDLAAGRIVYDIASFSQTSSDSENDIIRNVEQISGSVGNDVIIGGIGAETLSGDFGDDTIMGGRGRDLIVGGDGEDVFVFASALDSGITRATRDVISDFDMADDRIALLFDSNTRVGTANLGVQEQFVFVGVNTDFLSAATLASADQTNFAQVRAIWAGNATIVQIDTNGDRRADVTIELTGRLNLTADDFVFGQTAFNEII